MADSETRLRSILTDTPVMLHMLDANRRVVDVSDYWLSLLGYARSDVLGRKITDFLAPESRQRAEEIDFPRFEQEGIVPREIEYRFLTRDGSPLDVVLTATPVRESGGNWTVSYDVTERNKLLHELQSKEQLYRAVFDQSFQFLAVVGPDGSPKQVNETLSQFLGKFPEEIMGRKLWDIPGWSEMAGSAGRLEGLFRQAMKGDFVRDDIVVRGVDASARTVDLSLKPVRNEYGEIYLLIMEARDVTERREQEAMLAQAQKMEAVGQLTSGVAHDFNNLLMVIVGNLELLAARPGNDPRTKSRVEKALEAIGRGKALTHQLLTFSRKQELRPTPLDVNETLRGMSEVLKSTSSNVDVVFELADDLPLCRVDTNQLESTILNLAVNARDAMPEGGRLTISTGSGAIDRHYRVGFAHLPPGEYVRVEVTDTGHGIAPEHMAHLFEPFFTTKPPDKGTGLGLAMVYGFVKQSGGDIKVYSEVGKGTTFRIYLPKCDAPAAQEATGPENEPGSKAAQRPGRPRILVVEDEHDIREVAVTTLSDLGYDVEQAPDGDTAVAYFRMGRSYDLLITDIVMAGEHDGASVALMARAQYPAIGVVFASGFLEHAELGIKGARFLTKPFSVAELVRATRAALGQHPTEAAVS